MKFKNIEDVWAYAKNKLVNAQISSVQKTGSSKFFDITIPKSMVKRFPVDCNRQDLNYTITQVGSDIDCFLENNGMEMQIVDTSDFFDAISGWCGINESQEDLNQNAIIGVESSHRSGFDKTITFSYYTSRADLEKQLKKVGKPFALDVLPSNEAEIHVKNADVDKFKGVISALHEKIDTTMNMCMMEGITIKGRPLPDSMKSDFTSQERDYINSVIGNTWYQITPRSKVYAEVNKLAGKSKRIDHMRLGWFNYDMYEAPKGTKFLYIYDGYGADAYMFGDPKINESEAQDKYREFFENKLKQWNISSPAELTQEDRSKFFTEIRNEWKQQKSVNEALDLSKNKVDDSEKTIRYNTREINYINSIIGKSWYVIGWSDKEWDKCLKIANDSKKTDHKVLGNVSIDVYQRKNGSSFVKRNTTGYSEFYFGESKINESFVEGGYEILDQAEFLKEFGGSSNLASYALYSLYNTRLIVKCTPANPNYAQIRTKVETYPDVTANDKQGIKCYRQTASNLIIIYNNNIYWSYNTGTNLEILNEAELVKGIGKIFDTLPDTGSMSDNAVRAAIEALGGTMSELSTNPTTNSIKAYKVCDDTYQCLIGELEKRGLKPVNR